MSFEPYAIAISQKALDDLAQRLRQTRWPDEPADAGWSMGTNLEFMRDLVKHWLSGYDWRIHERALNRLPQYLAEVATELIHLFHARSVDPSAMPILLLHGWPDSNYRYSKVVTMLATGSPSFHVVAPSMPGFGFSTHRATNTREAATLMLSLMEQMGYDRFMIAGGDIGAVVAMSIAEAAPRAVIGLHLTDVGYPDPTTDVASLSEPEQEFARAIQSWWMREGAYNMVQSTKPQSLGFAMNDSPAGLAAWILSFMGSEHHDETLKRFTMDEIITNICLYWFTETAASSFRSYYENARATQGGQPAKRIDAPTAVLHPEWDAPLPREWANRRTNLHRFTELANTGHFAAWEKPREFVADVCEFAASLNKAH